MLITTKDLIFNIPRSFYLTMNPLEADGYMEAIIGLFIIVAYVVALSTESAHTQFLESMIALICGFYFGHKNLKYIQRKKSRRK